MAAREAHLVQHQRARRSVGRAIFRSSSVWTLAAILAAGVACRIWLATRGDPAESIRALGIMAPVVAVGLQATTMMTPVGSSVIPTVNGMVFPTLLAVALNLAGGLVGGVVMYFVWRRGEREIGIRQRVEAMPRWARRFARTDLASLIMLRMLPWAGGTLSTLMAGTYGIPLRVHVVSVFVGSLPGSIIYAMLGAGLLAL